MHIEKLHLSSFKGFYDYTLKCSNFLTVVGLNSGGKTSILHAIKLLHDFVVVVCHSRENPNFMHPRWQANANDVFTRMSIDPDAVWLNKITSNPCKISAEVSEGFELFLEITARNSYQFDILKNGNSIKTSGDQSEITKLLEQILNLFPVYIPPVGSVSPIEPLNINYAQLQQELEKGWIQQHWRSYLYWLWNDRRNEDFDQVVTTVERYLPGVRMLAPRLTHDHPPRVEIQFEEGGTILDISSSGGGLRTLLNLAVLLQFSPSQCLLLDEPDAHLHSTLQRAVARMLIDHAAEKDVQIIVASHAPDFIAEVSSDFLVWIDRSKTEGLPCSGIGKFLVDLGSLTKADAMRAYGADKILFIESSLDSRVLKQLIHLSGRKNPLDDPTVIQANLPSGKGDRTHLKAYKNLLRASLGLDVRVACITDNDYGVTILAEDDDPELPILTLGRKEIENYFLEPRVIAIAATEAVKIRQHSTSLELKCPTVTEIQTHLSQILDTSEIRDTVKFQIIPKYRENLDDRQDLSTKERISEQWFEENWNNQDWKIKYCPGKKVLRLIRKWCQDEFSITLTNSHLGQAIEQNTCPSDIEQIAEKLEKYFYQ